MVFPLVRPPKDAAQLRIISAEKRATIYTLATYAPSCETLRFQIEIGTLPGISDRHDQVVAPTLREVRFLGLCLSAAAFSSAFFLARSFRQRVRAALRAISGDRALDAPRTRPVNDAAHWRTISSLKACPHCGHSNLIFSRAIGLIINTKISSQLVAKSSMVSRSRIPYLVDMRN